jgi:hypothetical protein
MSVEMRADIAAIPWDLYRQRQLLNTPHLFAPGIAGLTEETLPLLLQETNKVFLPVPGQTRPRRRQRRSRLPWAPRRCGVLCVKGGSPLASSTRKSPDLAAVVARGTGHCANTYSYLFDLGLSERPHVLLEPYEPTPLV